MADPLSIIVAVIGLLKASYSVSNVLTDFVSGTQKAPQSALDTLNEIRAVTSILRMLQSYLDGAITAPRSRFSLLALEDIVTTLTDCVCTVSELEAVLDGMKTKDMGGLDRVRWVWNKDKIVKITARIQTQKQSLSLMFNILTCKSQSDAAEASTRLVDLVGQMLEQNQQLAKRVRSLEYARSSADSLRENPDDDTLMVVPNDLSEPSDGRALSSQMLEDSESTEDPDIAQHPAFAVEIETSLQSSRVYRRAQQHSHIRTSVLLDGQTIGSSLLSEISLSEISNISVFALPISISEISNGQHYLLEMSNLQLTLNEFPTNDLLAAINDISISSENEQSMTTADNSPQANFAKDPETNPLNAQPKLPMPLRKPSHLVIRSEVLFCAASIYEFNIDAGKSHHGFPWHTYIPGEIFDVVKVEFEGPDEFWLASNQDDPTHMLGWLWNKHFAVL